MHLILHAPPESEPLTLAEARQHLRLDASGSPATHPDDDLVTALIVAARQRVENETGRALISQQWDMLLEEFPAENGGQICIPRPPTLSVDSVAYVDADGETQAFGAESPNVSWRAIGKDNAILVPSYGVSWPATRSQLDAVTIRFTAGYGATAEDVPAPLKQAMLLDIGLLYEHREAVIAGANIAEVPLGWQALVWPYRRPVAG
jgi:uncharacterized phiE125 gp8 family phage protein